MNWTHPRYEEIKMDAEIGSYQVDPDLPERFAAPLPAAPEEGELIKKWSHGRRVSRARTSNMSARGAPAA